MQVTKIMIMMMTLIYRRRLRHANTLATLIFLFLWQFSFSISNAGIITLLYFLHRFLPLLSIRQDTLMQNIISFFPRSLNTALKLIGLDTDEFSQFTVCPKRSSAFNENDGYVINGNENVPKQCPFVKSSSDV